MKATAMSKPEMKSLPKPTVQELFTRLTNGVKQHWLVLPVGRAKPEITKLSKHDGAIPEISSAEELYILSVAAGLIHGENTTGIYTGFLPGVRDETCRQMTEAIKVGLQECYTKHKFAVGEKAFGKRIESLDKQAYFFASSEYPALPKPKPSIARIESLLKEALEKKKIRLTDTQALGGSQAPGHRDWDATADATVESSCEPEGIEQRKKSLTLWELSYVEAVVIELIHGLEKPEVLMKDHIPLSRYRNECTRWLVELYDYFNITQGTATLDRKLEMLDAVGMDFAERIYPDFGKQKS